MAFAFGSYVAYGEELLVMLVSDVPLLFDQVPEYTAPPTLTVPLELITTGFPALIAPEAVAVIVPPEAAGAVLCHVVPFEVSKLPAVPGATTCTAEVPLPNSTLLAVSEVAPVPPLATPNVPVTAEAKLSPEVLPVPPLATGSVPVTAVARGMFVTVLLAPLIVLLVTVLVLLAVRTLVGVMMLERFAMSYSG